MANLKDVANFFIIKSHDDQREDVDITPLKLQKLCYYAQGTHLAIYNKNLFNDEILAWMHGPAIQSLYEEYKHHASEVIPKPNNISLNDLNLNDDDKQTLSDVYSYFGQFSASKLRNMTHEELPWLNTKKNNVIDCELIKSYFKENVIA